MGRGRGPLLNPAVNGMMLGLCLGAGLMIWPRMPRWGKTLLVSFAALLCLGIFCTVTRSAWMGGALGLWLLIFLVLPRFYRPWFLAAAVLGSAVLVATQWANIVEFKRDKNRQRALTRPRRPNCVSFFAAIAWEMFRDRPLVGCGLGHYNDEHVNYLADRTTDVPLEQGRGYVQHNIWLSLLTRNRPDWSDAVRAADVRVAAKRLAIVAGRHRALVDAAAGAPLPRPRGKLPRQRNVPGHDHHSHGTHVPVLHGGSHGESANAGGRVAGSDGGGCRPEGAEMTATGSNATSSAPRWPLIDLMRWPAIYAIVWLHTVPISPASFDAADAIRRAVLRRGVRVPGFSGRVAQARADVCRIRL